MTQMTIILLVMAFSFSTLLISNMIPVYASTVPTTATIEQPKPGIIMIITFENGTTKAIRSDSTNLQAVNGGYFIADSSVKASQPIQSKSVSNTVVQQLVSAFVDVSIVEERTTSSEGCSEGWGYYVNDPNPICEPLDRIGQSPPPDMAFCAALGCPYNPPNPHQPPSGPDPDVPPATTPVESPGPGELSAAECAAIGCNPGDPISEPVEAQPPAEPEPAPEPDPGNGDQNDGGNDNEEGDGDGGSDEEESEE